jgi:hypothetical protein
MRRISVLLHPTHVMMLRISLLLFTLMCCCSTVSAQFVLYSNQNKPAGIVGNIIYADNTLAASITNGTYSATNRSSGGNDGSAYKTIQEAIYAMSAGDVLLMRGGTYHEYDIQLKDSATSSTWLKGTPGNLYTMQSYPGEWAIVNADHRETTNSDGTLTGYSVFRSRGSGTNNMEYWRFAYFEVTGGGPATIDPNTGATRTYANIQAATGKGFDIWPGQKVIFDHMLIHDNYGGGGPNGGTGISFEQSTFAANHILVTHSYLHDNGWPGSANENLANITLYSDYKMYTPGSIDIDTARSHNEIRYNLLENSSNALKHKGMQLLCIGDSSDYHSGTNMTAKTYGDLLHHNIIRNCYRAAYTTQDFMQIYNNIVENCQTGFYIGAPPSTGYREPFYACAYNNSIRNSSWVYGITLWKGWSASGSNYLTGSIHPHLSVYNNILLCGQAVDDIFLPINNCAMYSSNSNTQPMDMSTIDVNDNLLTGRAATTNSVRQLKVSYTTAGWLNMASGTEMWNVPDSTLVFAGTTGISAFYINANYQLPNGDTLATAGRGGSHPYLDGVTIPSYLGAIDPGDSTWPTDVQALTGLGTTIMGAAAFFPAPIAVNDSYTASANNTLTVAATSGLLLNDTGSGTLTAIKVANPLHGSVTVNSDGGFTYTPTTGYSGSDSFTYKANNGTDSNTATVSITIIMAVPTAVDDSYSVYANHTLTVSAASGLLLNDTGTGTLTSVKVSDPSHGSVSLSSDGGFTYTPTTGYSGSDSYTYKAHNASGDSNTATVSIAVNQPTRVLIDFGINFLSSTTAPNSDGRYWNNFTAYSGSPSVITSCTTSTGSLSGIKLTRTTNFNDRNYDTWVTAPVNGWPVIAASDNMYLVGTTNVGTMELSLLDTTGSKTYDLTVFGSINGSSTTRYTVLASSTTSQQVNCCDNSTRWATFSDLTPDANGKITLQVTLAVAGGRAPLNVIDLAIYDNSVGNGQSMMAGPGSSTTESASIATTAMATKTVSIGADSAASTSSVSSPANQNAAVALNVNFQPASVVAPQGYLIDSGLPFAKAGNGYTYGWTTDVSSFAVQRNNAASPDVRYDTAVMLVSGGTWEMAVPNGMYNVKIVAGDGSGTLTAQKFTVEGVPTTQTQTKASTGWSEESVTVVVTDGRLTITGNPGSSICFVQVTEK